MLDVDETILQEGSGETMPTQLTFTILQPARSSDHYEGCGRAAGLYGACQLSPGRGKFLQITEESVGRLEGPQVVDVKSSIGRGRHIWGSAGERYRVVAG
jgi:hypothetical protein